MRERCGADQIIEDMLSVNKRYRAELYTVEAGVIEKSIGPFLSIAMIQSKDNYLNLNKITPVKSKILRAKSIQLKMRAGAVRFDVKAAWFPTFLEELMSVAPSGVKGAHDDMFDAFAYIGLTIDQYWEGMSDEAREDMARYTGTDTVDEYIQDTDGMQMFNRDEVCSVTGY
jgi:predicted phage terminase large subunit-like protein